jgi:hypothetical protein
MTLSNCNFFAVCAGASLITVSLEGPDVCREGEFGEIAVSAASAMGVAYLGMPGLSHQTFALTLKDARGDPLDSLKYTRTGKLPRWLAWRAPLGSPRLVFLLFCVLASR